MNDLELYSRVLADANLSMALMAKQILIVALSETNSLEGLFSVFDDWHTHLQRLNALIKYYEEMMEKLVL